MLHLPVLAKGHYQSYGLFLPHFWSQEMAEQPKVLIPKATWSSLTHCLLYFLDYFKSIMKYSLGLGILSYNKVNKKKVEMDAG